MNKIGRIMKIIILVISILEITLTPFVRHDALILVCIMGWFNVAMLQLGDLIKN